ncbi:hypothetical protein AK830_g10016 [Neonectria ditissima]|uniref:N-acetyltransferase domain-containing protein n=1 Tax=Neonectria ditissima TaxID=78410 RepID=A0A0P7BBA0_9HYPO|nr:hypothetical protein AK830_g10016 [Neonectria ditissima]
MSLTSPTQLQPPSSSAAAMASAKTPAAEDTRPLTFEVLAAPVDKTDALNLVADSIAQERQVASRALVFNPLCVSVLVGVVSVVHFGTESIRRDVTSMLTTYSGLVLAYLLAIRYATSAYIRIAEETDWPGWLYGPDSGPADNVVLGARYGTEIIAAVVLQLHRGSARGKAKVNGKATIRAWTTSLRYRRRGLGGDMLREAIKTAKQTLGRNCVVEFAADHANSAMPLPPMLNGPITARRMRATNALAAAVREWEADESSQH